MSIGAFVAAAIDEGSKGRHDVSLALVCSAVDATATKYYPREAVGARYRKFLDDKMIIVTAFGFPGVYAGSVRIRCVNVPGIRMEADGRVSISAIIYAVVRCGLIHGCAVDKSIEFTEDTVLGDYVERFKIPTRLPLGLIMAVILCEKNAHERLDSSYFIEIGKTTKNLDDLWGRERDYVVYK